MQLEKQKENLMTREPTRKRPIAFGELLDLQNTLEIMRKKYKSLGWYERKEMESNAKNIKERIKKKTTQHKIFIKQQSDEYGRLVVDSLF